MPTYDEVPRFWRDWAALSPEEQKQFRLAVEQIVDDMKAKRPFRNGLRVRAFHNIPGAFEMRWSDEGRALFKYGTSPHQGDTHIIWLRVGTHDIYDHP